MIRSLLLLLLSATLLAGCENMTPCEHACEEVRKCTLTGNDNFTTFKHILCSQGLEACSDGSSLDSTTADTPLGQAGCFVSQLNAVAALMVWADGSLWDPIDSQRFCKAMTYIFTGAVGNTSSSDYTNSCGFASRDVCAEVHKDLSKKCKLPMPPQK